ncbi:MAG: hypothetical protein ACE5D6_03105 [Candidatus Zixiibacteriota bacterium]
MSGIELFQIWIIAFFTLALFSFLYKDNPVYKLAEHIFAGLTAGYQVGLIWDTVILQKLWDPMIYNGKWWLFLPGILGFLMFARFFPKYSWVSRTSLAFVMGTTAGVFITTQLHGLVLPAMKYTMLPLGGGSGFAAALLAIIVVIGVISTLIYFYFSKEHTGALGVTAKVGIWFIMISFGAHFGYTVMGRVSLLIGRVQFLAEDWVGSFSQLF